MERCAVKTLARTRNVRIGGWGGALALALAPLAARASDGEAITVTGHYTAHQADAASAGTVEGALLLDIPLLRPGEVLETVPGLLVTQHSGEGKANQYFLRGYNLDHGTDFATRVEGVPVNQPTNAHGQGYSDVNFLIPELVARIDYRKGPYDTRDGDFSAAGAADIAYRGSLDRPIADVTAGSYGYRRLLLADSARLSGHGPTLLGAGELVREDGPWTSPERLHKANFLLRLGDGVADGQGQGWSLTAIHYRAHWNATDQVPLDLIESGAIGRYQALDPTDGGDTGRDILSGEWRRDTGRAFTRIAGWVERYRLQLWSDFTYFENEAGLAPDPALPSDQFEQAETRTTAGARAAQGWRHGLGGRESVSELGLDWRHDAVDVALAHSQSRVVFEGVTDDHVDETALGFRAANSTRWSGWLRSVVGVRLDDLRLERRARILPVNSGRASASLLSPRASVIIGPFAATELFVSAGRGFHSNDARGVIGSVDPSTGASARTVPALVRALGKEVGLSTEAIPGWRSAIALWSLNSDSELVYSADAGDTEPQGASRRHGIEWNTHGAVGRWLLIDADYAWTHARYAGVNANGASGNFIANAVPEVVRLGATVHGTRAGWGSWTATIEGRHFGAYPLNQEGSLTAPATTLANLRLAVQPERGPSIALDVLNLFDRATYDIAYAQDYRVSPSAPVTAEGVTVHPGEPRQIRVTLSARW